MPVLHHLQRGEWIDSGEEARRRYLESFQRARGWLLRRAEAEIVHAAIDEVDATQGEGGHTGGAKQRARTSLTEDLVRPCSPIACLNILNSASVTGDAAHPQHAASAPPLPCATGIDASSTHAIATGLGHGTLRREMNSGTGQGAH